MKKNIFKYLTSLFVLALVVASCTEQADVLKSDYDYTPDATKLPTVTITLGAVTGASVEATGAVTYVGTDTVVIEKGFICATDQDFKVGVVSASNETADFHSVVPGLKELTDYYVKAYVITKDGIAYSEALPFSTPMLKNPLLVYCGTYIQSDYKLADGKLEAAYKVELKEIVGNVNQLTLVNFWDGGEEIVVNVNNAAKTISIAPQNIYTSATYGQTKPYPILNSAVVKDGTPVLGTIGADGVITLASWAASVTAGNFGTYTKSTLVPSSNALAGTYTEVDYKADGSVEATYTDKIIISAIPGELSKIKITNFWDGGNKEIMATVNFVAGTFTIAPQIIYVDASYGDCFIYPYDLTANTYDKTGTPTTGTIGTDGVLTVNPWVAAVSAGTFGKYSKSTLTKSAAAAIKAKMKVFSGLNSPISVMQPKFLK